MYVETFWLSLFIFAYVFQACQIFMVFMHFDKTHHDVLLLNARFWMKEYLIWNRFHFFFF